MPPLASKIVITNKSEQEVQIAKISESGIETSLDEILKSYSPIIEKIVVEQETIPYETITKDASQGATDKKNKVDINAKSVYNILNGENRD